MDHREAAMRPAVIAVVLISLQLGLREPAGAQAPVGSARASPLAELVELAREQSPEIQAAARRAAAAGARVPQAGALPDPVLETGLMYVPVPDLPLSAEGMTMFTVRLSQRVPVPGSRGMREEVAGALHLAALREVEAVELRVIARLEKAYYELLFVNEAEAVVRRNRALLEDLARVAGARLEVGRTPQQDVLRAHTEVTRLDEELVGLEDRRTAALAELNAVLDREPLTPLRPEFPRAVQAVATAVPGEGRFTAAALEGPLGSGLPDLEILQARALHSRPDLVAHVSRIDAFRTGVALAERERWPDMGWMFAYSPRVSRPDMVSLGVSVDLPLFRGRKQDQAVVEARELLADHEMRHHVMVAEIRSEVARRYSGLVRTRERILLLADGVIPQARAATEGAVGAYQTGRVEFTAVLEAHAVLFRHEIELARLLADFGRELAELGPAVGGPVLPFEGRTVETHDGLESGGER
jgi:outer membrane protein, heavy metal efflux system